jgi:hypothetical protein
MFEAKKLTDSTNMSGYLSDRVYDGKRNLSVSEVARRRYHIKKAADAAQQQDKTGKRQPERAGTYSELSLE